MDRMGNNYDTIIIGGGPAGLTAGVYASRNRFNTLLLEKGLCGGLPATTNLIENYPGYPDGINGMELINKFKEQAIKSSVAATSMILRIDDVIAAAKPPPPPPGPPGGMPPY